jgi:GT2 family glycosyltransferase
MKVICIIVLYECALEDSESINGVINNFVKYPELTESVGIITYENCSSPNSIHSNEINIISSYSTNENHGVAKAYNYALKIASSNNVDWLLLLDQDTRLNDDFLNNAVLSIKRLKDNTIAAIVPKIFDGNKLISPSNVKWGGVHRPIDLNFLGVPKNEVHCIGSGTMIQSSFMRKMGGFDEKYWLDGLDRWLFRKIFLQNRQVYVSNILINHSLSINDYNKFVSTDRFKNILLYESEFMKEFRSYFENLYFLLRLVRRGLMVSYSTKNSNYFLIALRITQSHFCSLVGLK